MRTELPATLLATDAGQRADEILRACVHCGFCNATCPTYQTLGDELDGPRGRIYLIKELLENGDNGARARTHLDRCLICRACETTCPSGVAYGELLEIGRAHLPPQAGWFKRLVRGVLLRVVPNRRLFRLTLRLGHAVRWLLPSALRAQLPRSGVAEQRPLAEAQSGGAERRVLLLQGCVQSVATPAVNTALAEVLARRGIASTTVADEQCCGGLALHLGADDRALATMRANVEAFAPHLPEVEAVLSTASGCGVTLADYGRLLGDAASQVGEFAQKVEDVSKYLTRLSETQPLERNSDHRRVAWHPPCTLQHGLKIRGTVERLLTDAGYELVAVPNAHLCCGSAGTYSILQPELATTLKADKLASLECNQPDVIATANVGCQLHLESEASVPVVHWLELVR